MEFLLGFLGALAAVTLLGFGIFMGRRSLGYPRRTQMREQSEEERRKLMQEQEAFRLLQNYTPERAYGQAEDSGEVQ